MRKITISQFQDVVDLFKSGISTKDIALKYGVTGITVRRVLKRMGIQFDQEKRYNGIRKVAAAHHRDIARLYYELQVSIRDIATLYEVQYGVIWRIVCKLRPTTQAKRA